MAVTEPLDRPQLSPSAPAVRQPPAGPVLTGALGLAVIALGFYLERTGRGSTATELVFWLGFVVLLAPIALRLLSTGARRPERIGLVVLFGTLIYGVKVLHDPLRFVISDEFIHLVAAQHIVASHALFIATSVAGGNVAASYPGLETLTACVAQASGLSLFVSGLIVVGLARAMMMVAVYAFAERVSGSARVAGIAALLFAANANFVFYSAQFSYESLAFPLFLVAVVMLVARSDGSAARASLTGTLVVLIGALTATHHVTSYVLALVLWVFTALSLRPGWRSARALGLAVFATASATAWFAFVATGTGTYLDSILNRTVNGARGLLSAGGARAPFQSSNSSSLASPLPERAVAYLALLILAFGLVTVLVRFRRFRLLATVGGTVAALASVGLLGLYPLRASANAWEAANRGQEILFPGAAVLLALAVAGISASGTARRRLLAGFGLVAVVCGGVISGWPYPLRLPKPLEVKVSTGRVIVPQGLAASSWAVDHLGRQTTYVADVDSGRELAVDGARMTYLGADGNIQQLLHAPTLPTWQMTFLRAGKIDYVLLDRRRISNDNLAGYFFPPSSDPSGGSGYYSDQTRSKFADANASEVYSSGDIVIFDVRGTHTPAPACADVGAASAGAGITCRRSSTLVTFAGPAGEATLSQMRLRMVATDVLRTRRGLRVTFVLQVQNFTGGSMRVDPGRHSFYIRLGGHDQRRTAAPRHSDGFTSSTRVGPHDSIEGSVTFVIRGLTRVRTAVRRGALLNFVVPPAASGSGSPAVAAILTGPLKRSTP